MQIPTERLGNALADRYRIERELGAGGMATVFLAQDLKHDRKVAVKVLKPELAAVLGGERFVVEIKTTASMSHPHILPLFDSGTADGFLFYVMPFIEGETLRDKLNRETQLGVDAAVRIASEVADALDYAHRHGVIHRDIKPENILLHDGRPMVADFGIALALSAAAGGRMTETGLSLGTPHYMSPEQATAEKEITGRSDVYSLASVLYEMLSGEPPHMGNSAQQIIMKIIADVPRPVTALRKAVPHNVAAAVAKALEKLPADRFESAKAFAAALHDPHFSTASMRGAPDVARAGVTSGWRGWLREPRTIVALATIAALGAYAVVRDRASGSSAAAATLRLSINLTGDSTVLALGERGPVNVAEPVVSPDGRSVLFGAMTATGSAVMLRPLDRFETITLAANDAIGGFFSPDGTRVAFFRENELWVMPLADRLASRLAVIPSIDYNITAATWLRDGRIMVATARGVYAVPVDGSAPTLMIPLRTDSTGLVFDIQELADGRLLLTSGLDADARIEETQADGSKLRKVLPGVERATIVDDIAIYHQAGQARAVRVNLGTLSPLGPSVALERIPATRLGRSFAWTDDNGGGIRRVVFRDASGRITPLPLEAGPLRWPRLSPDGRRLAVGEPLKVVDLARGVSWPLAGFTEPVWTPDGVYVISSSGSQNSLLSQGLVRQVADGSRPPDTLLTLTGIADAFPTSVSLDGKWVAHYGAVPSAEAGNIKVDPGDLYFLEIATRTRRHLAIPGNQKGARFSPNGRWIAYSSTETGPSEVYVRAWPSLERRTLVSAGGGDEPTWSRGSDTLFYRNRGNMMAVTLTYLDGALAASPPRVHFAEAFLRDKYGDQSYDIAPDGRFVLMQLPPRNGRPITLNVELNWIDEIRARLAKAK